jgi:hypothetical protein
VHDALLAQMARLIQGYYQRLLPFHMASLCVHANDEF